MLRLLTLIFSTSAVLAQSADLRVSLTMPPTAFYSGTLEAFASGMLTITNAGNVPAQDVTLDFGGRLSQSNPGMWPSGAKCNVTLPVRCMVPSVVPGSLSVPVYAYWYSDLAAGTVKTTSVTVSSPSTPDPDFTNNTASANTTILWQSDIALDSLNVPSTIASGNSAAIDATFSNHGPSPATDLSLTISIPPAPDTRATSPGSHPSTARSRRWADTAISSARRRTPTSSRTTPSRCW